MEPKENFLDAPPKKVARNLIFYAIPFILCLLMAGLVFDIIFQRQQFAHSYSQLQTQDSKQVTDLIQRNELLEKKINSLDAEVKSWSDIMSLISEQKTQAQMEEQKMALMIKAVSAIQRKLKIKPRVDQAINGIVLVPLPTSEKMVDDLKAQTAPIKADLQGLKQDIQDIRSALPKSPKP